MSDLSPSCEQKRTLQRPSFPPRLLCSSSYFQSRQSHLSHHTYELSFEAANAIHAAAAPEFIAPVNPPKPANEEAR